MFAILMAAAVVATAAICPALLFLLDPERQTALFDGSISPIPFVVAFGAANIAFSAVAIAIGLRLEPSVRMGVPLLRAWMAPRTGRAGFTREVLLRCFCLGFGFALVALLCGVTFRSRLPGLPQGFVFPPIWQGSLMILGASVRGELLFRYFGLNLLVWIFTRVSRRREPAEGLVWAAIVLIALLFAVMHLAPASQLLTLRGAATGAIIALGTAAGVLFGWVYWRNGLLLAMFTHAVCGLTLYFGVRGMIALTA